LSTRPIEQIRRTLTPDLRHAIVDGAYWQRPPGPNCEVVIAYAGAVAPEANEAVWRIAEDRRDVGLLAVTSADRLNAGWTAAPRARASPPSSPRPRTPRPSPRAPPPCAASSRSPPPPPRRPPAPARGTAPAGPPSAPTPPPSRGRPRPSTATTASMPTPSR